MINVDHTPCQILDDKNTTHHLHNVKGSICQKITYLVFPSTLNDYIMITK
jgi:hypothetical protein